MTVARAGVLQAMEALVYAPTWVLPILFLLGSSVPPDAQSWWAVKLHSLPENSMPRGWSVIGLTVISRPVILFTLKMLLASIGIVPVHRTWAEDLGDQLAKALRDGTSPLPPGEALVHRWQEGNVDAEHLDAAFWVWVFARSQGDARLERQCRARVNHFITHEHLRARAIVWCVRASATLSGPAAIFRPPICASVIPPRRA